MRGKFGITERSRVGQIIKRIAPRAQLPAAKVATGNHLGRFKRFASPMTDLVVDISGFFAP